MDKYKFDYGDESKLFRLWTIGFSEFWAKELNDRFLNRKLPKSVELSVQTLLEEIKTVVTQKYQLEYREKSILTALFDILDYKKNWWNYQRDWIFNRILLSKFIFFDADIQER